MLIEGKIRLCPLQAFPTGHFEDRTGAVIWPRECRIRRCSLWLHLVLSSPVGIALCVAGG